MVPARNESGFLSACLASIRAQDYPNLQIVVVDGGSTDDTVDVVRRHMARRHADRAGAADRAGPSRVAQPWRSPRPAAAGWSAWTRTPRSTRTYVRTAVTRLAGGLAGAASAAARTGSDARRPDAPSRWPWPAGFGVGNSTYHHGTELQEVDHIPFGAYPVALVRELGGWDERLVANEDFEFDYRLRRAGGRLLFDPDLRDRLALPAVDPGPVPAVPALRPRQGRRRRAAPGLAGPAAPRAARCSSPTWSAALAVALRRPRLAQAMLAPYAVALVAESVTARAAPGPAGPSRLRVPAAIVAMHVGWGLGFWSGLGRRARSYAKGASRAG